MLCDLARHLEGAEEIDIHLMLKLLIGDILSGGDCAGAGIVDQNVDPAEPLQNRSDCLLHILSVGNIAGDADRLHTELFADFRRDLIEQILPPRDCRDLCALACERLCHLHAETGRAAGDKRDLSAQIKIVFHPSSILSCCLDTETAHLHHTGALPAYTDYSIFAQKCQWMYGLLPARNINAPAEKNPRAKVLTNGLLCDIIYECRKPAAMIWARSSAGRAPRSQRGGQGFDPLRVHTEDPDASASGSVFLSENRNPRRQAGIPIH